MCALTVAVVDPDAPYPKHWIEGAKHALQLATPTLSVDVLVIALHLVHCVWTDHESPSSDRAASIWMITGFIARSVERYR